MLSFKEIVEQDRKTVFHNVEEFAEVKKITYGSHVVDAPIVLDHEIFADRKIPSGDHAGGIYRADVRAYINEANVSFVIKKGKRIKIGQREYSIERVSYEMGEIILDLEAYSE